MDARSFPARCFFLSVLVTVCSLTVGSDLASAQESKPWWNPFASEGDSTVRKSTFFDSTAKEAKPSSMFQLPKLPWTSTTTSKPAKSKSPSVLTRMGSSTKKAWNSTVDFLNPFDTPATTEKKQQGYQPQNVETSSGSGMFGWMWREEKRETPTTVNDFLRQERPRF